MRATPTTAAAQTTVMQSDDERRPRRHSSEVRGMMEDDKRKSTVCSQPRWRRSRGARNYRRAASNASLPRFGGHCTRWSRNSAVPSAANNRRRDNIARRRQKARRMDGDIIAAQLRPITHDITPPRESLESDRYASFRVSAKKTREGSTAGTSGIAARHFRDARRRAELPCGRFSASTRAGDTSGGNARWPQSATRRRAASPPRSVSGKDEPGQRGRYRSSAQKRRNHVSIWADPSVASMVDFGPRVEDSTTQS